MTSLTCESRSFLRDLISQIRRLSVGAPADGILHGTEHGYQRQCCRCRLCRDASARARRQRRRQPTPWPHNRDKTHCIHGHEFTPENTYVRPKGWRECRACHRLNARTAVARVERAGSSAAAQAPTDAARSSEPIPCSFNGPGGAPVGASATGAIGGKV